VEAFLKKIRFPFTIGYGMTECGPLISYASWEEHRPASVGFPVNYLEVKIDSDDPQQTVGSILVRGENVMTGYYKNSEATQEVLSEDGWLNTGDLGLVDQDGVIYIKGRSKNLILGPSGQNIYPEEIEMQLNNLPFVQEALVFQENGKMFALVCPDLEAAEAKEIGEGELREKMEENRKLLNSRLPAYSTIYRIGLYPKEFEKTPTRKIKRFLYNMSHLDGVKE
jgi:long-chain acyl-CoA synthetase